MSLFDPAALQLAVERTLASSPEIPEGAKGAFLTIANHEGVKAVIAVRVADGWQIRAAVSHGWNKEDSIEYGIEIRGTW